MITYVSFHAVTTLPIIVLLYFLAAPFLTRAHGFQIATLCLVAFFATLPWDAYLISQRIWTYPPSAVLGPTLFGVPVEELFFFVAQTYVTSLVHILVNKPVLHVRYLHTQRDTPKRLKQAKLAGQLVLAGLAGYGAHLIGIGGRHAYLGFILAWAAPLALITWSVAGTFILSLPWSTTAIPILIPTVYFWAADSAALEAGIWHISDETKLGIRLFGALDIEEAVFFLAANVLIVLGLATFDQYLAVMHAFPSLFPTVPRSPSPLLLLLDRRRLIDTANYDMGRIAAIRDAVERLQKKSRSFYIASAAFSGRVRIDLILLYSFCRTADDLIDDAKSSHTVSQLIEKFRMFLELRYGGKADDVRKADMFVGSEFPPSARTAFKLLPADILPREYLEDLVRGFEIDACFGRHDTTPHRFPIVDEGMLEQYAHCVAGSVGRLCIALITKHNNRRQDNHGNKGGLASSEEDLILKNDEVGDAADRMGVALQYINIARDIEIDAKLGRVYLPTTWLSEEGISPQAVLHNPMDKKSSAAVDRLRHRLLDRAFELYDDALPCMRNLPRGIIGPIRVAVENYMDIGRVMRGDRSKAWKTRVARGKATVPLYMRVQTIVEMLWIEEEHDGECYLHI